VSRTKIHEQHLILLVVNDRNQVGTELGQIMRVELTKENGELGVVATTFEMVKHLAPTFVVGNVVADEIVSSRGHRVVMLV
jgi:hypothetical protein